MVSEDSKSRGMKYEALICVDRKGKGGEWGQMLRHSLTPANKKLGYYS